jgi:hypothetical protein
MKKLVLLPLLALVGVLLAGCNNTQTYASQCAYQIQNGYFDARHVKNILHPGERKNTNNSQTRYVYCNARNYIVTKQQDVGDLHTPITAKTGKNQYGDGTPVELQESMFFTLNQNEPVMLKFLPFCEKYSCFSKKDTNNNADQAHSSSPGWNNLLAENVRFALRRATQNAMLQFAPDVWNDQSKWPQIADKISADLKTQLRGQTGSGDEDFFCGSGASQIPGKSQSAPDAYTCPDIRVSIEDIEPQDPQVKNIYNKQVQQQNLRQLADEEKKTNEAQLEAAKAKYGSRAEYFLGLQDTCAKAQTCVINPPLTSRP